MAGHLSVPGADARPNFTRSRSSTSPNTMVTTESSQTNSTRPSRPTHARSKSYVFPTEPKPTNATSLPDAPSGKPPEISKFHRLHLPRRSHDKLSAIEEPRPGPRSTQGKHRYTQSEAQQYHRRNGSTPINESPSTPSIIMSSASSTDLHSDMLYPSSRGAAIPSLMRIASTRSYRGQPGIDVAGTDPRSGLRRRATSDTRSPTHEHANHQLRPAHKTLIEIELERADQKRKTVYVNATESDVKRMDKKLRDAASELQERLTSATRSASDLIHRLDDAQDTLFRTAESLNDTISSFSTLSAQSAKLIDNFEHEAQHLDKETQRRIAHYRTTICVNRAKKVDRIEKRGQAIGKKAEELSQRLENCRTIVRNWEAREINKRRAWRGIWVGVLWGLALIIIAILAGVISWKAVEVNRGRGTPEQQLRRLTVNNKSHNLDVLQNLEVPDEVKKILIEINDRDRQSHLPEIPRPRDTLGRTAKIREEKSLHLLDEL